MAKRILLIEDDADARLLFKHVLTKAGYAVDELENGNGFMNGNVTHPNLFVLDMCMPMIDGIALTKYLKLKEQTKDIPIVIVSADPHIRKKALRVGAAAFIGKPFEVGEFLTTIRNLISRPENELPIPDTQLQTSVRQQPIA